MDDTKMPEAGGGQPAKLDFSVKVFPVQEKDGSNLRAFASIDLGGVFAVTNLRVLEGKNGTFVSMPQTKGKDDKYHDICFPTTKEMRQAITDAVLEEYSKTKDLSVEKVEERPSARKNLQQKKVQAAEKAEEQPAPAPKKKVDRGER